MLKVGQGQPRPPPPSPEGKLSALKLPSHALNLSRLQLSSDHQQVHLRAVIIILKNPLS